MDTFAAIALGSERPHPSVIKNGPVQKEDALITGSMLKQIYGMSIYIFIMSTILYFFVDDMWDIAYDNSMNLYDTDGYATNKAVVYTMIFNSFVWMHIFNEFNCRKVGARQYNVFNGLIQNWVFLIVITVIICLQVFFVELCGSLANTTPLTGKQHAFCILIGSSTLLVSVLLKLLPNKLTSKLPHLVNENQNVADDKLMAAFNKQANAKVTKRN
jgi:Ca2+-transporting ATPase